MSFRDQSWESRLTKMGDEAEEMFEAVCEDELKLRFWRYGLNRPPLQMHSLPARIRYTPDYLLSKKMIEVQGFGRDQRVKMKMDKWMSLHFWHTLHPVELFLWDSHNSRWCFIGLDQFDDLLAANGTIERFPEGKVYVALVGNDVFEVADLVGEVA